MASFQFTVRSVFNSAAWPAAPKLPPLARVDGDCAGTPITTVTAMLSPLGKTVSAGIDQASTVISILAVSTEYQAFVAAMRVLPAGQTAQILISYDLVSNHIVVNALTML